MTSLIPLELNAPLITYDHSPLLRTINQLIERVLIQETANNAANERIGKLEEALEQANNRWNQTQPSTHPSALSSPAQSTHSNDDVVVDPSVTTPSDDAPSSSPVNKGVSALTSPKRQVDDSRVVDIEKHLAEIDAKLAELDEATKQNQTALTSLSSTPDSDQSITQSVNQSSSSPAQSNKTIDPRLPALEAKVESLNMAVANLELIDRPKNSQSSPSSALSDQLVSGMVSSALEKQLPEIEKSILSQAAIAANQSISQSISSSANPSPFVKSPSIVTTPVNSVVTPSSDSTNGKDDERLQNVESRLSQLENTLSQVKQSSEQSISQSNETAKKLIDIEQGTTQDRAKWSAQVDVLKQSIGQSLKQSRDVAAELSSRPVSSLTNNSTPVSSSKADSIPSEQLSSPTITDEQNASHPVDITALNAQVAALIVGQHALGEDFRQSHDAQQVANRTVNQQIVDLNTSMDMISGQLQQLHDRSLAATSQPVNQSINQSSPIFTPKGVVNATSEIDSNDRTLSNASGEHAIEVAQGVARQLALLEREFSTLSGRVNSLQTAVQSSTNQSANQSTSLSLLSSALAAQTIAPPAPTADAEAYAHIHYSIKQLRGEQADLASKSMALASQVAALQKRDQSINDVGTDLRASVARVETGFNKQIAQLTTSQKNALELTARSLKSDILDTERRLNDSINQSVNRTDRDLRAHIAASLEPFALVSETSAGRMPMTVKCFSCGSGAQTVSGPASLKWIQTHGQGSQPTVLPTTHVSEMRIDKGREMYVGGRDGQLYKGRERGSVAMLKGDEDRQQGFNVTYGKLPPVNQPGGGQTARGNLSNRNSLENLPSNQNEEEKEALDTTSSGAGLNQTVSSFVTERE